MTLPAHLFVSSCDGALYDTRVPHWSSLPPLRANYRRGQRDIASAADLKAALRHGPYAWPGGYPLYFIASDGEALSFDSVRESLREILGAIQDQDNSGWRVIACDVNYEDTELYCAHNGKQIESAYSDDADDDSDSSEES
jgi:hypothetical protein